MKKNPKCVLTKYRVITTQFWRLAYEIQAESCGAAMVMYNCLVQTRSLPVPTRTLLHEIEEPEQVIDENGKLVWSNPPQPDDAERFLMMAMWREMRSVPDAVEASINFIARSRGWDAAAIRREIGA